MNNVSKTGPLLTVLSTITSPSLTSISIWVSSNEGTPFEEVDWKELDALLSQESFTRLCKVNLAYLLVPTWTMKEQPKGVLVEKFPCLSTRRVLDTRPSAYPFKWCVFWSTLV